MPFAKAQTKAVKYDRPITIQTPTIADDGQGGSTTTWSTYYKCFASIESFARGRGMIRPFFAGQLYPEHSRLIAVRWQTSFPIDDTMRIVSVIAGKQHIFQIPGVDNFQAANVEIVMLCQELRATGSP